MRYIQVNMITLEESLYFCNLLYTTSGKEDKRHTPLLKKNHAHLRQSHILVTELKLTIITFKNLTVEL